jgi:hypothetical protein
MRLRLPVLPVLYVVAFAVLVGLAELGREYYLTPLPLRPRHPLYWTLKPGGRLGLLYGITGATLMVLMLVYSVRKRIRFLRRLGTLGSWLDFHIFCGVVGPLFIVLHSSFKVQGLVALSFWSMVVVALSGVLGRFLYLQIPRTRSGDELSLAEAEVMDAELSRRLREELGLDPAAVETLQAAAERGVDPRASTLLLVPRMVLGALALRVRLWRFRRRHREVPRQLARAFAAAVRQKALLRRRILLWQRLHAVFHYWHVAHRPFAAIMYLFMAVHIAVAWWTGYAGGGLG